MPKCNKEQAESSQKLCRRLANLWRKVWNYGWRKLLHFGRSFMPSNDDFYSDDIAECPDDVRYVELENFTKKILVSVAISSKRVSGPFLRLTNSSIR